HFGIEEQVEQAPHLSLFQQFSGRPAAHGTVEIRIVHLELDAVLLRHEIAEMPHHMQQHFVAVAHHQRPAHAPNSLAAAPKADGSISSAAAAASRSGSWPSRKSHTACSVDDWSRLARSSSGCRPVSVRNRSARTGSCKIQAKACSASGAACKFVVGELWIIAI